MGGPPRNAAPTPSDQQAPEADERSSNESRSIDPGIDPGINAGLRGRRHPQGRRVRCRCRYIRRDEWHRRDQWAPALMTDEECSARGPHAPTTEQRPGPPAANVGSARRPKLSPAVPAGTSASELGSHVAPPAEVVHRLVLEPLQPFRRPRRDLRRAQACRTPPRASTATGVSLSRRRRRAWYRTSPPSAIGLRRGRSGSEIDEHVDTGSECTGHPLLGNIGEAPP